MGTAIVLLMGVVCVFNERKMIFIAGEHSTVEREGLRVSV